MNFRYSNGEISVTQNPKDEGLFGGLNLSNINEKETKANIERAIEDGSIQDYSYSNELLIPNEATAQKDEMRHQLFSGIDEKSTIVGAKFQPLIVKATLEKDNKEYEIFGTFKNNSDNSKITFLKAFEVLKDGENRKLVEAPIDNFKNYYELNDAIFNIYNEVIDNFDDPKNKSIFIDFYNSLKNIDESGLRFWNQDENGSIILKTKAEDLELVSKNLISAIEKSPLKDFYKEKFPESFNTLNSFLQNNTTLNLIKMQSNDIFNNRVSENSGIEIIDTSIEEYEIVAVTPDKKHAITLEFSNFPKAVDEKAFDMYKNSYIDESVRSNMELFKNKAKEDIFTAYHLARTIDFQARKVRQELGGVIQKERDGELTTREAQDKIAIITKDHENILNPLVDDFPSIGFYGKSLHNSFVNNQKDSLDKISAMRKIIDIFTAKVTTAINFLNDSKKINPTADGDKIRNLSTNTRIPYSGSIPAGNSIASFQTKGDIKGTLLSDNKVIPSIHPTEIFFPSKTLVDKKGETIKSDPKVYYPHYSTSVSNEISLVLSSLKKDEIKFEKAVDDLVKKANNELGWKQYTKTKKDLESIIALITRHKNDKDTLYDIVSDISNGEKVKGLSSSALRFIAYSFNELNSIKNDEFYGIFYKKQSKNKIEKNIKGEKPTFVTPESVSSPNDTDFVIKNKTNAVNEEIANLSKLNQGYQALVERLSTETQKAKEENPFATNPLYDSGKIAQNPTIQSPIRSFVDENGDKKSYLNSPYSSISTRADEDSMDIYEAGDKKYYIPNSIKTSAVLRELFQNPNNNGTIPSLREQLYAEVKEDIKAPLISQNNINARTLKESSRAVNLSSIVTQIEEKEKQQNEAVVEKVSTAKPKEQTLDFVAEENLISIQDEPSFQDPDMFNEEGIFGEIAFPDDFNDSFDFDEDIGSIDIGSGIGVDDNQPKKSSGTKPKM